MKNVFESTDFMESLGWTLVNSLWQGLAIYILLIVVLRLIPSRNARLRYVMSCASVILFLIANISTFAYLFGQNSQTVAHSATTQNYSFTHSIESTGLRVSWIDVIAQQISEMMPLIIVAWAIGSIVFMIRIVTGWWYINRLKLNATIIDDWSDRINELATQIGISKIIHVAESVHIQTPMVIGFVRPMILIPVGMISGLSTEQLEAIFIHELAHIKRHDYVVNLIQTIVESIFFFNPFVWSISRIIRREREYCCDDAVTESTKNTLVYAKALAHLEEVRLSSPMLAMTLGENKNQLLDRIKRIMKNSTKNYSSMDKVVPAVLLVVGLICASWLTINSEKYEGDKKRVASDTIKRKNRVSSYSKSTVITFDKDGNPHEETIERSSDEDWQPVIPPMELAEIVDFPLPIAPFDVEMFEAPIEPMPPMFPLELDSVPFPGMRLRQGNEWKEFGQAFEEKFRSEFGDFYKSNTREFEKMMKELAEDFEKKFSEDEFVTRMDPKMSVEEKQRMMADMARMQAEISRDVSENMKELQENARQQMQIAQEQQIEGLRNLELSMADQQENMKNLEMNLKVMEEQMKAFEKELREQLVMDGYIKKGDEINNIRWDDDGDSMEVNGIKIKSSDQKKYKELHQKYFNHSIGKLE